MGFSILIKIKFQSKLSSFPFISSIGHVPQALDSKFPRVEKGVS